MFAWCQEVVERRGQLKMILSEATKARHMHCCISVSIISIFISACSLNKNDNTKRISPQQHVKLSSTAPTTAKLHNNQVDPRQNLQNPRRDCLQRETRGATVDVSQLGQTPTVQSDVVVEPSVHLIAGDKGRGLS